MVPYYLHNLTKKMLSLFLHFFKKVYSKYRVPSAASDIDSENLSRILPASEP